ncbi:MAG: hypothetical protein ABSG65_21145 [Bryobacteraceae bacterium]
MLLAIPGLIDVQGRAVTPLCIGIAAQVMLDDAEVKEVAGDARMHGAVKLAIHGQRPLKQGIRQGEMAEI